MVRMHRLGDEKELQENDKRFLCLQKSVEWPRKRDKRVKFSWETRIHFWSTWLACGQHAASQTLDRDTHFEDKALENHVGFLCLGPWALSWFWKLATKWHGLEARQLFAAVYLHQLLQLHAEPHDILLHPGNIPKHDQARRCPWVSIPSLEVSLLP